MTHVMDSDPFDVALITPSIFDRLPLVTNDPVFKAFGVETAW